MSRGEAVLAVLVLIGAGIIAYQVMGLVELYLADCYPPPVPAEEGPAAWEISQLIEEARRITREASDDDPR